MIFLHLSRQCNDPELVGALHAGADYAYTITEQHRVSRWVWVRPPVGERPAPEVVIRQPSLFGPEGRP